MDLISDIILCFVLFLFLVGKINAEDKFASWHRTLTPLQSHACDGEELVLQCSNVTIISVHFVSYGSQKETSHLCPGSTAPHPGQCRSTNALKVITDNCHTYRMCRLLMLPNRFGVDTCPGIRKYIEVMYKCRPASFLNKIVCENGHLRLVCPAGQGLTIYSATFGTTQPAAAECHQPDGIQTVDCLNNVDDTVRSMCSGKESCTLRADVRTLGDPHCLGTKYLKIKYNCMEKMYILPSTSPPSGETIQTTSYPAWAIGVDQSGPNNFRSREYGLNGIQSSDSSKLEMQSDEVPTNYKKETLSGNQELVGFMSKWVSAQKYMTGNKDKLILYVSLSLGLGIVACATVLSARCLIHRLESHRRRRSKFAMTPETEDQFFSDSDLEQYDPPDPLPPPPPIANYTASMKRHGSDASPRAPIDNGVEHNHYFS